MNSGKMIKINCEAPDQKTVGWAAETLIRQGVVVAPTETKYGILVRADRATNVRQLYAIKQRDLNLPTAIFVSSSSELSQYLNLNDQAQRLSQKFLPGPLTLVGESVSNLEAPVVIDGKIGLRVSSSRVMTALTKAVGLPLTATSANFSGQSEPIECGEIVEKFGEAVDLYLDAGPLNGPPSTVIDISVIPPRLLREGAISSDEIVAVVGAVQ